MDTKTLAFTLVLVLASLALLALMLVKDRRDPALTTWALGLAGSAVGFALILVNGVWESIALYFLGNVLVVTYCLSLPLGLRWFLGVRPLWSWWSSLLLGLWLLALLAFAVFLPSYQGRVTATSLYMAWLTGEFLFVLVTRGSSIPVRLRALLGGATLVYIALQVVRAAAVHWSGATAILDETSLSTLTFLISIAVAILWAGGLLVLDSHRLRTTIEADSVELRRLNLLKDRVLAMTGHDLRGPLSNLRLIWDEWGRQIREGKCSELDPELLILVDRSLAGTQDLLENLFSFAEGQKALKDPQQRAVLASALAGATDLWTAAAKTKNVALINEGGEAPLVKANQEAVAAVLRNLVGNAIKFTPSGGCVTLRLGVDSSPQAYIEVSDTGVGIDLARLARGEGLAEKTSRTGTAGERGSGFGLVLVRELVDGWKGTLTFESEPGKGTKVRVSFPLEVDA